MAKTNRDIKYINRDFESFRSRLIEFSQTYFPSTYNDFSPTSPGMMFMEQSSYVGDVLSFYLDRFREFPSMSLGFFLNQRIDNNKRG